MTIIEELRHNPESGAKWLESEYKMGLLTIASRLCADLSDAEELVNRTLAAVVDGIDGFLEQSSLFTWMCQILVNIHAKDMRRKADGIVVCPGDVPDVADESMRDRIFRDVDGALLRDAVEALPPHLKRPVVLHYFMEISVRDAARLLSIPAGTFAWRLHCARDILAAKLCATARKPGGKALLIALALAALTAVGAAVWTAASGAWNAFGDDRGIPAANGGNHGLPAADGSLPAFRLSTFDDASGGTPEASRTTGDNMNLKSTSAALLAAATAATTAAISSPADIYVAKTGSDANPGTSIQPKLTIQAGVDAVASGGTVHVAPGIYGDCTTDATYGNVCVLITNKTITLAASGAKAETVILGKRHPGVDHGMGASAVRGIVSKNATGTVISGFTIRNCCTQKDTSSNGNSVPYQGGGIYVSGSVTVVDCDIQACSAERGGGAYGGTFVRCRFTGCVGAFFGSAGTSISAYNCVFAGNLATSYRSRTLYAGVIRDPGVVINCTLAFNQGAPFSQITATRVYNCVVVGSQTWTSDAPASSLNYCATDAANASSTCVAITADDLFSPATGDWRLKTGSAAIGAGNVGKVSSIPAAYRDTDILGNPRKTGDTVNCGAAEASATPVETGALFVSCTPQYGLMSVDGAVTASAMPLPLRVESLPAEPTVSFLPIDGYGMVVLESSAGAGNANWPLMDETVPMRIAAASATAITNSLRAGAVYHVAPSGNDVNGDGSEAAPYATFAKAVGLNSAPKLILAHAGDYGYLTPSSYRGYNRVQMTQSHILRIKAVDGPSATVIPGASDETGESGLGANAVRCVAIESTSALQGFTLRGGRTAAPSASSATQKRGGGAQIENGNGSVLDCVIEDCIGAWGSAIASGTGGGHAVRCVIRNCSVPAGANADYAVAINANLDSCLFDGNSFPSAATSSTVIGPSCNARFCTVVGTSTPFGAISSSAKAWNCIAHGTTGGGVDLRGYNFFNGLFGTSAQNASSYTTAVQGRPRFADEAARDYRLRDRSAAVSAGSLENVTLRNLVDVTGIKYELGDSAAGTCVAGCHAEIIETPAATFITIR